MEEVAVLKAKLKDAEKLQVESRERYQHMSDHYQQEIQSYKGQVENVNNM